MFRLLIFLLAQTLLGSDSSVHIGALCLCSPAKQLQTQDIWSFKQAIPSHLRGAKQSEHTSEAGPVSPASDFQTSFADSGGFDYLETFWMFGIFS